MGVVCKGHRKDDLNKDEYATTYHGEDVRRAFLAAILRMADELDISWKRAPHAVQNSVGDFDNIQSQFHWIKHRYVENPSKCTKTKGNRNEIDIMINALVPHENYIKRLIEPFVVNPIQAQLEKVRGILTENGLFLKIIPHIVVEGQIPGLKVKERHECEIYRKYFKFTRSKHSSGTESFLESLGFGQQERDIIVFTILTTDPVWGESLDDVYCDVNYKFILDSTSTKDGDNFKTGIIELKKKDRNMLAEDRDLNYRINIKILCDYIKQQTAIITGYSLDDYLAKVNQLAAFFVEMLFNMVYYVPIEGTTVSLYDPDYRAVAVLERANRDAPIRELKVQAYSYHNNIDEICDILKVLVDQNTEMQFLFINPFCSPYIRRLKDVCNIVEAAQRLHELDKGTDRSCIAIKFYSGDQNELELLFRGHIIDERVVTFATWPFAIETEDKAEMKIKALGAGEVKLSDPRHGVKITYLAGERTNTLKLYKTHFNSLWNDELKPTYEDLEALIRAYKEQPIAPSDFSELMQRENPALADKWKLDKKIVQDRLEALIKERR